MNIYIFYLNFPLLFRRFLTYFRCRGDGDIEIIFEVVKISNDEDENHRMALTEIPPCLAGHFHFTTDESRSKRLEYYKEKLHNFQSKIDVYEGEKRDLLESFKQVNKSIETILRTFVEQKHFKAVTDFLGDIDSLSQSVVSPFVNDESEKMREMQQAISQCRPAVKPKAISDLVIFALSLQLLLYY